MYEHPKSMNDNKLALFLFAELGGGTMYMPRVVVT